MSDSPKMSIPEFKYKLQTCKIKSSKLSSLIDSFRPFVNQTCSIKLLVKSNNLRIFTNFKTLGHEFSIYALIPTKASTVYKRIFIYLF